MKPEIVLIGGGGHCKSCIDVIEQEKKYRIAGIIDRDKVPGNDLLGYPYMGTDNDISEIKQQVPLFLITLGQIRSSQKRFDLFVRVKKEGGCLPVVISPLSYCSTHSHMGEGTIVMHNSLINAHVRIGKNCIINTGAVVEHDTIIGSHTHVSTGAILNGGVRVKSHTFIGSRAVIRDGVCIGKDVIVSAGVSVFKDIPDGTTVKECWK